MEGRDLTTELYICVIEQYSAEPGFEPGTLWLEGRDLTTAPTTSPLELLLHKVLSRSQIVFSTYREKIAKKSNHKQKNAKLDIHELVGVFAYVCVELLKVIVERLECQH